MSLPSRELEGIRQDAERDEHRLLRSRRKDEALEIAIKAAETSMRALKLAQDPNEKAWLSTRVKQLLQEAEHIKFSKHWQQEVRLPASPTVFTPPGVPIPRHSVKLLRDPRTSRQLSNSEQIILFKAGYLNGFKSPPWKDPPAPNDFDLRDGEDLFIDSPELNLSVFQNEVLDDWMRPTDALPPPAWFPGDRTNLGPGMSFARKIDLVQDAATDCSVVASLCSIVARAERGHSNILRSVIYPYDAENERPLMSMNGKYIFRLNFNGCHRKVVVDDRLPVSGTGRVIHVIDRHNPGLLWPALVEKAYLKIRGGYDFPGSNSATDLWMLTSWIPEQVFVQSDELDLGRLWKRMSNAFDYGDLLVTLGTGKMSPKTERELGLASEHDYTVLDVREVDGQRLMLIKNPWCEGTSWRGRFKESERPDTGPSQHIAEQILIELDDDSGPVQCARDLLNADAQLSPGTFWMDVENVVQNFESIYLNWNPSLFAFREDAHFTWDLSQANPEATPRSRFGSMCRHPQFTVTASKGGTVWILLWRHLRNSIPAGATDEEIESSQHHIDLNGHISLAAFCSQGNRVMLVDNYSEKGYFVDSPQTLLKLDDSKTGEMFTICPLEQDLSPIEQTFTMSVFSNSPIVISEAFARHPYVNTLAAVWTKETAGGNAHSPTYCKNPQFSLAVPHRTSISLMLEAENDELNVHVKLVHSKGERIHSIRNRDIVFDSQEYRRCCCLAESAELEAGQYTIVCSTFEPQQLSSFTLLVESSYPTQMVLLPREGAGRLRMELSTVIFKRGDTKVAAPLVPRKLVKFHATARHLAERNSAAPSSCRSMIRLSVEIGRGPQRRIIIASSDGEYAQSESGVRTDEIDLSPDMKRYGDMWLVLDRVLVNSEAQEDCFPVELFVDQPDSVTCGVWRGWED